MVSYELAFVDCVRRTTKKAGKNEVPSRPPFFGTGILPDSREAVSQAVNIEILTKFNSESENDKREIDAYADQLPRIPDTSSAPATTTDPIVKRSTEGYLG